MAKKLLLTVCMSLGLLSMAGTALAAGGKNQDTTTYQSHSELPVHGLASWYVAPMFAYTFEDQERSSERGLGGTLRIGKVLSDHINLELSLSGNHYLDGSTSWDTFSAGIHGLYFFARDLPLSNRFQLSPFVDLGVALARTRNEYPGDEFYHTDPVFSADLGATIRLNDYGMKLRLEGGYKWAFYNVASGRTVFGEPQALIGLSIPLSAQQPRNVVTDHDHDSVADSRDMCPNTPAGMRVNSEGCALDSDSDGVTYADDQCPNTPAGTRVTANGCAQDTDHDGVLYEADMCPNTPAGQPVNASGCAQDTDGDGVPDGADQCPSTAAGLQVTKDGCVVEATGTLENVHFATGNAQLTADSRKALRKEAELLKEVFKRHSEAYATVNGYTDNRGAASFNQQLSKKRAESVRSFLIGLGVAPSRLEAVGHGETNPIASNATAAGRLQNRRVSIAVHKK